MILLHFKVSHCRFFVYFLFCCLCSYTALIFFCFLKRKLITHVRLKPKFFHSIGSKIVVRPEEALIVIFVLILWAGAIGLFVHRWGKIRNCEPYTPKFEAEDHRGSCHDQTNLINKRMSMSVTKQGMPGTSQQNSLPSQMTLSGGKGNALRNLTQRTLNFYLLQASHRLTRALDRIPCLYRLFK